MAGALFGAIVLSRELKRIALVKPQGCPVWCFPIGEVEGQDGTVAAISVVDKQTGVNIRGKISEDFVEAEFPAGSGTQCRLYMAYDVPDGTMQPAPESAIEQASWHPVEEIVNLPPDTSAEEQPVMPFVQGLKQWIARNHELRVKGDEKFGWNLIYAKDRWIGIKPQMVLRNHLQGNQCPLPHYETFEPQSVPNPNSSAGPGSKVYCATCTLPHLGVQITPEFSYIDQESAIENAALAAFVYLEGGCDVQSTFVNITCVGEPPHVNNPWNEQAERKAAAERELKQAADSLVGDYPTTLQLTNQGTDGAANAVRQIGNPVRRQKAKNPGPVGKNAIQELKELCDRKKWIQPRYDYSVENGLFVCTVALVGAGIEGLSTTGHTNQKQSKLEAAQLVIAELTRQNLYISPFQTGANATLPHQ